MDRNYYRMMDDVDLLREAAENPTAELAVVLGERMEAVSTSYEGEIELYATRAERFEREADQSDDEKYELERKISHLEDTIDAMAEEIEQLKETAK